jgi:5-methylcytosine-specific restriction endonuclease McrA
MVDHIIEIKDGGALTSEDNAQALCWKCHGLKTAAERAKRKNHQQSHNDNRVDKETRAAEGENQFTHEIY